MGALKIEKQIIDDLRPPTVLPPIPEMTYHVTRVRIRWFLCPYSVGVVVVWRTFINCLRFATRSLDRVNIDKWKQACFRLN